MNTPYLMFAAWRDLSADEQVRALDLAAQDAHALASAFYGPDGSRREDETTVGYQAYAACYLVRVHDETQARWNAMTVREVCHDPRVYTFVATLERARRHLVGETPLGIDVPLLDQANGITQAIAEQISAEVWAQAQLSEMVLRHARDRAARRETLAATAPES